MSEEHRVYDLKERSDIDRDQKIKADALGESWGDGFHVTPELVKIDRGPDGRIVRTTPLSEIPIMPWDKEEEAEPLLSDRAYPTPSPLNTRQREQVVKTMAVRLLEWYQSQPPHPSRYNPIYDGIPELPEGSPENLQPLPGTQLYPATPQEVYAYLAKFLGKRAEFVNKKDGRTGYKEPIDTVRIHKRPVRS